MLHIKFGFVNLEVSEKKMFENGGQTTNDDGWTDGRRSMGIL